MRGLRVCGAVAGSCCLELELLPPAAALWGSAVMTLEEIHGQEPVPAGHDWYVWAAAGAGGRTDCGGERGGRWGRLRRRADSAPLPARRMQGAGKALHELLVSAQRRGCLTAGVYESAKLMNV